MSKVTEMSVKALNKTRENLTKLYRILLIGKEIYKTSQTNTKFIGTITDVDVCRFTEFNDVVLTIHTADRSFNVFGCNLNDKDLQFGWFYKSKDVI